MWQSQQELTACFHYPDTYKLEIESSSMNEVLQLFCETILQGCSFSNVESYLIEYVTSIIDPVGWKAIWRSKENPIQSLTKYDFIVEVLKYIFLKVIILNLYVYFLAYSCIICHFI